MTSGDVLLCDLNPIASREQGGIRPVAVVSMVTSLAVSQLSKTV
jgi:mRNA-degrading endonuclease toxin of MazEF toxin-antitoxin module